MKISGEAAKILYKDEVTNNYFEIDSEYLKELRKEMSFFEYLKLKREISKEKEVTYKISKGNWAKFPTWFISIPTAIYHILMIIKYLCEVFK